MSAPTTDDLHAITEQVWLSYLDPEGVNPFLPSSEAPESPLVIASVSVTGAWEGHVIMTFSEQAAELASAALLGMEADEVTPDDVADAVGELVNVIGGNVKSLLPDGSLLSLPHVVTGDSAGTAKWPATVEICRLQGSWQEEKIAISVWTSKSAGEGS
ncbi:chemotaxis protein CheX [Planomonospora sp. ID82291]|uniref:chemotaxis protein CheX n=1 Tax=Planomonospora sp. ID82291 TaxID=2738136 RepID=UPI0018C42A71|nr:chemotaxis protein CheX [Planomonospora sp. ID82291]MBG0818626.1 chemotaxis protein CheX [Planomonospora sp. ID82291]